MFYNNPNLQCLKIFLEKSSHKNGNLILQYDMSACITVYHNTIVYLEKAASISKSFVNHLKVFCCDNYENIKFNRRQKILLQHYVSLFTF